MSYSVTLQTDAQHEYEASLRWYMERSYPAAEKFVEAVDNALHLICENPTRWRNNYKNFYEISLKKYPFTVIYTIEKDEQLIVVLSIYHHKRNPKRKYRKL